MKLKKKFMVPSISEQQLGPRHHHARLVAQVSPEQHGLSSHMAPGHQHGPRWIARPWAFLELLLATGAMDITPDPSLHRATDLDMALGSRLCLQVSMPSGGSTSHPDQHGSGHGMMDMVQGG